MSSTSTNLTINVFDDPIFYVHLTGVAFFIPTIILLSVLLHQIHAHKLYRELSASLLFNIHCWWLLMILGAFSSSYMASRLESSFKSAFVVLNAGMLFCALGLSISISVLLMSVDRIVALATPIRHRHFRRPFVFLTMFGCFFAFSVDYFAIFVFEPPLPEYTSCKSLVCIITPQISLVINTMRSCTGILNVFAFLLFRISHYKYWNRAYINQLTHEQFKRANYCVLVACSTELAFNVIPQTLSIVLLKFFNTSTARFGPINSTLIGIEGLVTTLIYRYLITKHTGRNAVMVVPTISSP